MPPLLILQMEASSRRKVTRECHSKVIENTDETILRRPLNVCGNELVRMLSSPSGIQGASNI